MRRYTRFRLAASFLVVATCLALFVGSLHAQEGLSTDGLTFPTSVDFLHSDYFKASGLRCGTLSAEDRALLYPTLKADASDCNASSTNPTAEYDPGEVWEITVVVHVIMNSACTGGVLSDEQVESQIDILNEDFLALAGTNGAPGNYTGIQFKLATTDPQGQPTTGITRSCNTTWFNDGGSYFNSLAWDPNRYMNIYTNRASGALGYVPFLPADNGGALVGGNSDRVVVLWSSFGRDGVIGPPFNLGRTATHEVGHYLGMEHTFSGGCGTATPPGCYTTGDLICDTNAESTPSSSPCAVGDKVTCGSVDPSDNYMDYSDDQCMNKFTVEQLRRMRCSMQFYRPEIYAPVSGSEEIFTDTFESGNTSQWSTSTP